VAKDTRDWQLQMVCLFLHIQWNLSKPNLLGTNFFVRNRQVFCLYRLNLKKMSYIRTLIKVWFIQDFGLFRFDCTCNKFYCTCNKFDCTCNKFDCTCNKFYCTCNKFYCTCNKFYCTCNKLTVHVISFTVHVISFTVHVISLLYM
jgi:hypothetical protein